MKLVIVAGRFGGAVSLPGQRCMGRHNELRNSLNSIKTGLF